MKIRHELTAVIYDRKGNVLSIGKNSYVKTHPMQLFHAKKTGNPGKIYLHAEIHAIVKLKELTKAHRIFVSRWDKKNIPRLAKPCDVCLSAIRATGIQIIEHT